MGKRVFMFPGQGSQYVGMAKDIYDEYEVARQVFARAGEAAGFSVEELVFTENDKLNITEYTQICMLAAEAAIFAVLKEAGVSYDLTAGLSLGEYGALIASGAMSDADAFRVVRERGKYMQQAVPEGGAMAAVLNLDAATIAKACEEVQAAGPDGEFAADLPYVVSVANYNSPVQTVITGRADAVAKAGEKCSELGARRVVPLNVSGPFHSALLQGAGAELSKVLDEVTVSEITVPYIANVTADFVTKAEDVKPLLVRQVSSSVRWVETVERLLAEGVDEFVEIGPGTTLTGFVKRVNKEVNCVNISNLEELKAYLGK